MGNSKLATIANNRLRRKNLDTPISGSNGFLDVGEHEVKITGIDLSEFSSKGYIDISFEGISGGTHRERMWTFAKDNNEEYDKRLIAFINALFQDPNIFITLDELMSDVNIQEGMFQIFKGMKLKVHIERTPGYLIERVDKGYKLVDNNGDDLDNRLFNSIKEAREVAVAKQLKRSWTRIFEHEALCDEILSDNRKHFDASIEGLKQATKVVGSVRQIFDTRALKTITR